MQVENCNNQQWPLGNLFFWILKSIQTSNTDHEKISQNVHKFYSKKASKTSYRFQTIDMDNKKFGKFWYCKIDFQWLNPRNPREFRARLSARTVWLPQLPLCDGGDLFYVLM